MDEFLKDSPLSLEEIENHECLRINAFDTNYRVVIWNKHVAELFGIPKEKAVGKTLQELFPLIDQQGRFSILKRAFYGQKVQLLRQKYLTRPGYYDQLLLPLKDRKGNIVGVLNIVEDNKE